MYYLTDVLRCIGRDEKLVLVSKKTTENLHSKSKSILEINCFQEPRVDMCLLNSHICKIELSIVRLANFLK